ILEARPVAGLFRRATIDRVDLEHRRVLLVAGGRPAQPDDVVALAQAVLAGELHRHVGVVAAGEVVADPKEAVALVAHVEVALDDDRLGADRRAVLVEQLAVLALGTVLAAAALAAPAAPLAVAFLAGLVLLVLTIALLAIALLAVLGRARSPGGVVRPCLGPVTVGAVAVGGGTVGAGALGRGRRVAVAPVLRGGGRLGRGIATG